MIEFNQENIYIKSLKEIDENHDKFNSFINDLNDNQIKFDEQQDLNLSNNFYHYEVIPIKNSELNTHIIDVKKEKIQLTKPSDDFSDLSSISEIENNYNTKENYVDQRNVNINDEFSSEMKIEYEVDQKYTYSKENNVINLLIDQNLDIKIKQSPKKRRKRKKEDLDKTPIPIFDCIYCSNEKVVFTHMIRNILSEKYLLLSTERSLNKINTILLTSISINNTQDIELQQLRDFIIYHTEYLNKYYDTSTSNNYFKSNFTEDTYKSPILKKFLFHNIHEGKSSINRNSQVETNKIKSRILGKNNISKNCFSSEISPNFSSYDSLKNFNFTNVKKEEEILIKNIEKTIITGNVKENREDFSVHNGSFLNFLKFDLKRKINYEDIIWEEDFHDIWNPKTSITEDNSSLKDVKEVPSSFLKILNNYYKNKNPCHEIVLPEEDDLEVEEETIHMKNFSENIEDVTNEINIAEASGNSIKAIISNFFEQKNELTSIKSVYQLQNMNNPHSIKYNSFRQNNHKVSTSIKQRKLSAKKYRVDSLGSISDKSQSLFNSMSQFKTLITDHSDWNLKNYRFLNRSKENKFFDVAKSQNTSFLKKKDLSTSFSRLKTDYKNQRNKIFSNTEKKNLFTSTKELNSHYLSSSIKNFSKYKYSKNRDNKNENLFDNQLSHIDIAKSFKYSFHQKEHKKENIKYLKSPLKRVQKENITHKENSLTQLVSYFKKKFPEVSNSINSNATTYSNTFTKSSLSNTIGGFNKEKNKKTSQETNKGFLNSFREKENITLKDNLSVGIEKSNPKNISFNVKSLSTSNATSNLDKLKQMIKDYDKESNKNNLRDFFNFQNSSARIEILGRRNLTNNIQYRQEKVDKLNSDINFYSKFK